MLFRTTSCISTVPVSMRTCPSGVVISQDEIWLRHVVDDADDFERLGRCAHRAAEAVVPFFRVHPWPASTPPW